MSVGLSFSVVHPPNTQQPLYGQPSPIEGYFTVGHMGALVGQMLYLSWPREGANQQANVGSLQAQGKESHITERKKQIGQCWEKGPPSRDTVWPAPSTAFAWRSESCELMLLLGLMQNH